MHAYDGLGICSFYFAWIFNFFLIILVLFSIIVVVVVVILFRCLYTPPAMRFVFYHFPFWFHCFYLALTLTHSFCLSFPCARTVSPRAGIRKYVVWCLICGGLSCLLGTMFLGVYFLVRSYTSTIGYFETVPTFVPATLVSNFIAIFSI